MTSYQHSLVNQTSETRQLYLTTDDFYHSFKFLPNFDDMIVQRLREQNDSDTLEN